MQMQMQMATHEVSPPASPTSLTHPTLHAVPRTTNKMHVIDVILPDSSIRQVEVDPKSNGQECITKVCLMLGITEEIDYFGLTFYGAKHELLWVNMRNRLVKQIPGTSPYRLHLRVKFFVQPHMVLQQEARNIMFLDVCRHITSGDWRQGASDELKACLIAELCQAQHGDFQLQSTPCQYRKYHLFVNPSEAQSNDDDTSTATIPTANAYDIPREIIAAAASHQRTLLGISVAAAERRLMQTATKLPLYGVLFHDAKDCFENKVVLGVGPDAILVCDSNRQVVERFAYPRVQKVTISDRVFFLSLAMEDGNVREFGYRLVSQRAANGLYRCVTETHSFFRCDTVRNDVTAQTSRDIKGALVSLFSDHDTSQGRDFVFDVRRTGREVYDDARRKLFSCSSAVEENTLDTSVDVMTPEIVTAPFVHQELLRLRQKVEKYEDQKLCKVCMDEQICRVFIPCGHMSCCALCATKVTCCPLCRQQIAATYPVYAPWVNE